MLSVQEATSCEAIIIPEGSWIPCTALVQGILHGNLNSNS